MNRKITTRISAVIAAATMALSMQTSLCAAAAERTPEEAKAAYNELYAHSRTFRVDDEIFTKKYEELKKDFEKHPVWYDFAIDISTYVPNINYADYQIIRDKINELYSNDGFHALSFPVTDDMIKYDIDEDKRLSYYDYCYILRYAHDQLGLTDEYTDFSGKETSPSTVENDRLSLYTWEDWITIKKLVSNDSIITLPSEVCFKVNTEVVENGEKKKVASWCILPVMNIGDNAFKECPNMVKLNILDYVQPKWFKKVDKYDAELYNGELRTIETGGKVADSTYIDISDNAFSGCKNLAIINFGKNVNFSRYAFNGTRFGEQSENVWEDENTGIWYVRSSDKKSKVACAADPNKSIQFRDGKYNLDIEAGTTSIANNIKDAFTSVDNYKEISVNIPDTVEYIKSDAFSPGNVWDYDKWEWVNADCSGIKWINGKTLEEIGRENAQLKQYLVDNNGSFKCSKFMAEYVQKIINNETANINNTYGYDHSRDREKIEAVCQYIFNRADYSSYLSDRKDFSLFSNGDYNTLDQPRGNICAATNAFLTDYTQCESFAMATALLLDKLNIPNYLLGCEGHAYNGVYVDGKWYVIDMSAYGNYDRNSEVYERSENTSFIRDLTSVEFSDGKTYMAVNSPKEIFTENDSSSNNYPGVTISGKSQFAAFATNRLIEEDIAFNVVGVNEDKNRLIVAVPSNNIPASIAEDINNGRIESYQHNGVILINGELYYYENNNMLSNSTLTIDDKRVKIDSMGRIKTKGVINVGDKKYGFDDDESLARNKMIEDEGKDGNIYTYRFDDNYEPCVGWVQDGDNYYVFDKEYHMIKDAFVEWEGLYFYLDEKGVMATNKYVAWKNGWRLHADSFGSVDISVLGESERAQFISELTSY